MCYGYTIPTLHVLMHGAHTCTQGIPSSGMTFEQAVPLVKTDVRYNALRSLGEKKQCFNEYKVQRAREEKVRNTT